MISEEFVGHAMSLYRGFFTGSRDLVGNTSSEAMNHRDDARLAAIQDASSQSELDERKPKWRSQGP